MHRSHVRAACFLIAQVVQQHPCHRQGGRTLCGKRVYQMHSEFEPGEASCRICRRRYEIATGRR